MNLLKISEGYWDSVLTLDQLIKAYTDCIRAWYDKLIINENILSFYAKNEFASKLICF